MNSTELKALSLRTALNQRAVQLDALRNSGQASDMAVRALKTQIRDLEFELTAL